MKLAAHKLKEHLALCKLGKKLSAVAKHFNNHMQRHWKKIISGGLNSGRCKNIMLQFVPKNGRTRMRKQQWKQMVAFIL